jgi:hypothetical protein
LLLLKLDDPDSLVEELPYINLLLAVNGEMLRSALQEQGVDEQGEFF